MRKNTLIKLLAVLAMCFLIGAVLVSCGEGETEDADAKAIVGVEVKDGKLVFAYNDGTVANVALPEAEACEHKAPVQIITQEHARKADGTFTNDQVLNVCNDCHEAWVTYEVKHQFVAGEFTMAPTCTEVGYTTTHICEVCGEPSEKTNIVDAAGHSWGEWAYVSGDACEGGVQRRICSVCTEFEDKTVAAADASDFDGIHTVTTWNKVVDPTFDATGSITGACAVCGDVVNKNIGKLPAKMKSNDEYTFDAENSTLLVVCGSAAKYVYIHEATELVYEVNVAAQADVKHELNGKLMTSVEQVAPGTEFETAYIYEDTPGIRLFENHPLVCNEAVFAHFECTAIHDDGEVCGADISVYVRAKHTTVEADWVTVGDTPACVKGVTQTQACKKCSLTDTRTLEKQDHKYEYKNDTLFAEGKDGAAIFNPALEANIAKVPYYQGVCSYCKGTQYKAATDYKYEEVVAATCRANGEGKVTYKKASDGAVVTVKVVLAQFAHKTIVNGEKVAIIEGKEDIKVKIYNADHADYKNLVKELDNVTFSTDVPVLGYISCECTCKGCELHDVTVWVQKLGADADAIVAFN